MSTTRTRTTSHPPRPPLESLIYALVPNLAPPTRYRSGATARSAADGEASTGSHSRPSSRMEADEDAERDRKEKVKELMEFCGEIMGSHHLANTSTSLKILPEAAKKWLLQAANAPGSSGSGVSATGRSTASERIAAFSSTWSKLERGRTLATPLPHLQFLMALSEWNPTGSGKSAPPSVASTSRLPSTVPLPALPPARPSASSSRSVPLKQTSKATLSVDPDGKAWTDKGKSKADVLTAWRTAHARPPFPAHLLLRDALYLLQGIDGRYVRFAVRPPVNPNPYAASSGGNWNNVTQTAQADSHGRHGSGVETGSVDEIIGIDIVADEVEDGYISAPTRALLVQLSELGMLYRRVTSFVNARQGVIHGKGGMTEQSLCHFLHIELTEYHRLLAVLESQMSLNGPLEDSLPSTSEAAAKPAVGAGLTLMRLGLWTEEMRLKMRMMSLVVEDAKTAHGGALVSRIHSHTSHGDPFVRKFTDQILEEVSKPFFSTLQRWIFSGELHDPFQEFFVQLNHELAGHDGFENGLESSGGRDEAHRVWEKKYVFEKGMVPGFVSEEFGKKIFSTGRSLNFIRYSCQDSDWIQTQAKLANAGRALKYSDIAGLERSIDQAYSIASQRLLDVFFDKFVLLEHLRALKSYLMLGAGDFTELLMEALSPRLSKPANSLYRHHLTSDLESAIRGSNAQYDSPDILRRLDARILGFSHGEIGWDCFVLEYKVEAPLNAVLDDKAMLEYERIFHHLWRLKRVESTLTDGWMRVTSGSRLFEALPSLNNDWHHARIVQAEMVHFLRQMQAFCQLEVIECSWQSFIEFTEKREGDLDSLIQAHRTYLDRVVRKVLLLNPKRDKEETLLDLVRDALEQILQFRDATDSLYGWSLAEATRLDRTRDAERGLYTASADDSEAERSHDQLRSIRERVRACSIGFQDRLVQICHTAGSHPDLDIRFLAIRIAFNGHYSLRRSARGTSKSSRA